MTRANFAFFQTNTDGDIFGTDSWADPICLWGFNDWMEEDGFSIAHGMNRENHQTADIIITKKDYSTWHIKPVRKSTRPSGVGA